MFINDIEYNIRLYVYDPETDEDIAEELFEDLAQMARFVEKTYRDEKFIDAKATYTFVEVVNGVSEKAGTYFYDIDPYYPLDEKELKEILQEMTEDDPENEERKRLWGQELAFHPEAEQYEAGDASKDIPLSEFSYICPSCFNEIKACTCRSYPYNLIQIDKLMVPVIKELNCKGYITMYCCAGHPGFKSNQDDQFIYIMFKEDYEFPVLFPAGSIYTKHDRSLRYDFPDNREPGALKEYQLNCIDALMDWAHTL